MKKGVFIKDRAAYSFWCKSVISSRLLQENVGPKFQIRFVLQERIVVEGVHHEGHRYPLRKHAMVH